MSNREEVISNLEITTEKTGAAEEYITKTEAIRAVTGARMPDRTADGVTIANGKRSVTDCIRRIREIPAADVRPAVRGDWIQNEDLTVNECSKCGYSFYYEGYIAFFNFCPCCGADMRRVKR